MLVSLEFGGKMQMPYTPFMRWGSHVPLLAVRRLPLPIATHCRMALLGVWQPLAMLWLTRAKGVDGLWMLIVGALTPPLLAPETPTPLSLRKKRALWPSEKSTLAAAVCLGALFLVQGREPQRDHRHPPPPSPPHPRAPPVPASQVLAVMFIIPHDPSCSMLSPDRFGSWGLIIGSSLSGGSGSRGSTGTHSPQHAHAHARYQPVQSLAATSPPESSTAAAHLWPDLKAWQTQLQAAADTLRPPAPPLAQLRAAVRVRRSLRDAKSASSELVEAFSCMLEYQYTHDVHAAAEGAAAATAATAAATAATAAADASSFFPLASYPNATSVPTTVEQLRLSYGHRQNWLWGDLDACATRRLYHELLPTQLLEEDSSLPMPERARLAVAARRAARLYARERGTLPVSLSSGLLDGMRALLQQGSFQPDGLSEEQIWAKYARQWGLPEEALLKLVGGLRDEGSNIEDFDEEFFQLVLKKSCTSNEFVDCLVGLHTTT